jgi:hypothetical protein
MVVYFPDLPKVINRRSGPQLPSAGPPQVIQSTSACRVSADEFQFSMGSHWARVYLMALSQSFSDYHPLAALSSGSTP